MYQEEAVMRLPAQPRQLYSKHMVKCFLHYHFDCTLLKQSLRVVPKVVDQAAVQVWLVERTTDSPTSCYSVVRQL